MQINVVWDKAWKVISCLLQAHLCLIWFIIGSKGRRNNFWLPFRAIFWILELRAILEIVWRHYSALNYIHERRADDDAALRHILQYWFLRPHLTLLKMIKLGRHRHAVAVSKLLDMLECGLALSCLLFQRRFIVILKSVPIMIGLVARIHARIFVVVEDLFLESQQPLPTLLFFRCGLQGPLQRYFRRFADLFRYLINNPLIIRNISIRLLIEL